MLNHLGHLLKRRVHRRAYRLGDSWQVRGVVESQDESFPEGGTVVEMGCRFRRGGMGKIRGTKCRLGSLIVKTSIMGVRMVAGIKPP